VTASRSILSAGVASLLFALTACQAVNSVSPPQTLLGRVSSELPAVSVARNTPFQLPAQARVLFVVQAESRIAAEQSLIQSASQWFSARQAAGQVAPEPLLADEAVAMASRLDADFLLTARIVEWPSGSGEESQCPFESHPSCQVSASGERLWLSLRVDDLGAARVVDTLSVQQTDSFPIGSDGRTLLARESLEKMLGTLLP
jgi:hypothetical protein